MEIVPTFNFGYARDIYIHSINPNYSNITYREVSIYSWSLQVTQITNATNI